MQAACSCTSRSESEHSTASAALTAVTVVTLSVCPPAATPASVVAFPPAVLPCCCSVPVVAVPTSKLLAVAAAVTCCAVSTVCSSCSKKVRYPPHAPKPEMPDCMAVATVRHSCGVPAWYADSSRGVSCDTLKLAARAKHASSRGGRCRHSASWHHASRDVSGGWSLRVREGERSTTKPSASPSRPPMSYLCATGSRVCARARVMAGRGNTGYRNSRAARHASTLSSCTWSSTGLQVNRSASRGDATPSN
mmetsp:Transcript_19779/g.50205  ORF Transcript_19779/g.50205 Transcript_19779/m.50205 type:complete len:250 (-) Transcript_19779:144-893(-)